MKVIKKGIRILGFGILILCSYVLLVLLTSIIPIAATSSNKKVVDVFLMTNGVHTDIVVPIKSTYMDWSSRVKIEDTKAKNRNAKYVAFGWGDKGFYLDTPTWGDLKCSTALKAATGISSSAMHCTFYRNKKEGENVKKIALSEEEYQKLITYILDSFQVQSGEFIKINTNAVYGANDVFYEANGSYSLMYTCNTWVNQALKAANQKAALWTVFDFGIFYHYK